MSDKPETIFVIVPFYNEEKLISTLVAALKEQTDQGFHVVFVDNNSTDKTAALLRTLQADAPYTYELLTEQEKGTGCASDTGFRHAIAGGARYLARTDADCLPDRNWISAIRTRLIDEERDFIGGVIRPRTDDIPVSMWERLVIAGMIFISDLYGKIRYAIGPYRYVFFMVAGNNLAITADMYVRSGGFPRTSIDTTDEDLVLAESVRKLTRKAKHCCDMIVYNSVRRLKAYGHWNILMWYKERTYRPAVVDIR